MYCVKEEEKKGRILVCGVVMMKKKRWMYAALFIILLIVGMLGYTLIRYPLRTQIGSLTGMDVMNADWQLWHWGEEVPITDTASKEFLFDALDGELKRGTGDWIGKTGGVDWVLKMSDGRKEAQIILHPGNYWTIHYGHYDYHAEGSLTEEDMERLFNEQ